MKSDNRGKLINATRAAIGARGFSDVTVSEISRQAGISAGFVHYYFGGKEGLLAATMQSLGQAMRSRIARDLRKTGNPAERLRALIRANFDEQIFTVENCRTWVAFWSLTHQIPAFARMERIDVGRTRSNLRHALKLLASPKDAGLITEELIAMLGGLWVRRSLNDPHATPQASLALTLDHLARRIEMTTRKPARS